MLSDSQQLVGDLLLCPASPAPVAIAGFALLGPGVQCHCCHGWRVHAFVPVLLPKHPGELRATKCEPWKKLVPSKSKQSTDGCSKVMGCWSVRIEEVAPLPGESRAKPGELSWYTYYNLCSDKSKPTKLLSTNQATRSKHNKTQQNQTYWGKGNQPTEPWQTKWPQIK